MSLQNLYPPMRGLANLPWYFGLFGTSANSSSITGTSGAPNAVPSSTIHQKGSWAQTTASLATDCGLIIVTCGELAIVNTETSALLDIGVGAAGSETVIVPNVAVGGNQGGGNASRQGLCFFVPVRIAAGSRVAVRSQCAVASRSVQVVMSYYNFGEANALVPTSVDVLGTNTATSRGTVMSGASGSYVEITASTSRRYRAICVVPSVPTNNVSATIGVRFTVAVGAAGSEQDLGSSIGVFTTSEAVSSHGSNPALPIGCDVPAGSRLSVKHDIGSNPGEYACCLIGVP